MTFGQALQACEASVRGPTLAKAALGAEATATKVRDWANYLSKIEHDRVPGVGLDRIRDIAAALGYDRLSKFFAAIEEVQDKGKDFVTGSLRDAKASDKTTLSTVHRPGGERGASSTLRSADDLKRSIETDLYLTSPSSFSADLASEAANLCSGSCWRVQATDSISLD
jgi:transcriptional regulator with XRE-family HTH domain